MCQDAVVELLKQEGVEEVKGRAIVHNIWEDGHGVYKTKTLADLSTLFKILKNNNIKIAVCTSDQRKGTEHLLEELGVVDLVDHIVCGDDPNSVPKPAADNAHLICNKLGVKPEDTVMVGDTKADVGMGKAAKLGWNIGVLSGVGQTNDLYPAASHVIESVQDLLPLILPEDQWRECYAYSNDQRILIEPYSLESSSSDEFASVENHVSKVALVILDLHGTILCTHSKYSGWLDQICSRLEQATGLHDLTTEIHQRLGICERTGKIMDGLLNEHGTTNMEVRSSLVEMIHKHLTYEETLMVVNKVWQECESLLLEEPKSLHKDVKNFFKTLKRKGIKIAICTGDQRELALSDLKNLGVLKYIDMMVCGDDPHSICKSPDQSTRLICDELNVIPEKTVIVGDSTKDFQFEKSAKVHKIGVLSGVGSADDLKWVTDLVVPSVDHVIDHIMEEPPASPGKQMVPPDVIPVIRKPGGIGAQCRLFGTRTQLRQPFTFTVKGAQVRNFATVSEDRATCDYVIVGAGSAGCTLTNRLSADPNNKVCVLEAGPKDYSWKIHMPAALMYNLCDDKYNWYYHTEPEPHMNNRVMYWPRGRVWGGSSSLNAMVYIRGNAGDYDGWEKAGAKGWSYADCLPYFQKAQTHNLGGNEYRGGEGPLHVSRGKADNPLHHAFIEAGQQAGFLFTDDMNGYQQEGVGLMDMTIHKGRRWSAAVAYLRPALKRDNVKVESNALSTRILFENKRAVGVEYEQKGVKKVIRAEKEVILSGGSINSPQLLMLSGIGNADELKALNIPVVQHLPGVGENLQDHLEVYVQEACKLPITLYSAQWKFPHNMIRIGLQWFLTQKGDGATTHLESGGFVSSEEGLEYPDIQFHFLPSTVYDHGRVNGNEHAYQLHVGPMRATSRGYIKLKTSNPRDHPKIVANYLSTEYDRRTMRDSIKVARKVFRQKAFDPFRAGREISPGPEYQTDAELDAFSRAHGDSSYHPSCTCKIGAETDPMAVVDSQTSVFGVDNLRVVDASIMPNVITGNLNGPTIMLAEKAADIILGKTPLPRSTAPVYKNKV
ncbi:choline dehydrogenase, mitochondrial-like isoform X2 [Mizuhopecten yessoensis]|nr:choline dehydrogenase, mitochondrial-like isoform X2 [Mizuhopecten yessoensis]